jgi:hypothetical protein
MSSRTDWVKADSFTLPGTHSRVTAGDLIVNLLFFFFSAAQYNLCDANAYVNCILLLLFCLREVRAE